MKKDQEHRPAAREGVESQYETGYTTGDTGNELDRSHVDHLYKYAIKLHMKETHHKNLPFFFQENWEKNSKS